MTDKPKWIAEFTSDEPIVSMAQFVDGNEKRILIATSKRVFELVGDNLYPLKISNVVFEDYDENP